MLFEGVILEPVHQKVIIKRLKENVKIHWALLKQWSFNGTRAKWRKEDERIHQLIEFERIICVIWENRNPISTELNVNWNAHFRTHLFEQIFGFSLQFVLLFEFVLFVYFVLPQSFILSVKNDARTLRENVLSALYVSSVQATSFRVLALDKSRLKRSFDRHYRIYFLPSIINKNKNSSNTNTNNNNDDNDNGKKNAQSQNSNWMKTVSKLKLEWWYENTHKCSCGQSKRQVHG